MKILFGITGSIAAIKFMDVIGELKNECKKRNIIIELKYVATDIAYEKFMKSFAEEIYVLLDKDEWKWEKRTDPILHIDLRNWADIFVICPLDANTLACIANGLASNLLTCVCRCWDFNKPFLVFPCMNTFMYNHPVTSKHKEVITSWGIKIIEPIEKKLACGDYGIGGLPDIKVVVSKILEYIH